MAHQEFKHSYRERRSREYWEHKAVIGMLKKHLENMFREAFMEKVDIEEFEHNPVAVMFSCKVSDYGPEIERTYIMQSVPVETRIINPTNDWICDFIEPSNKSTWQRLKAAWKYVTQGNGRKKAR